jgi:hypothetical protein
MRPITPGVVARSRVQPRQEHGHLSPPDLHPAHAFVPTLRPSLPTDAPSGAKVGPAKIILASARSPRRRHAASNRTRGAGRLAGTPERFWRCADAAPPPSAHGWGRRVFRTAHRPQQLARTLMRPRRAGNRRDRSSVQRNQKRLLDVNANPPGGIVWTLRWGLACSSNRNRPAVPGATPRSGPVSGTARLLDCRSSGPRGSARS